MLPDSMDNGGPCPADKVQEQRDDANHRNNPEEIAGKRDCPVVA